MRAVSVIPLPLPKPIGLKFGKHGVIVFETKVGQEIWSTPMPDIRQITTYPAGKPDIEVEKKFLLKNLLLCSCQLSAVAAGSC